MQMASIYFDALLSIQNPHIICNNTHIGAYVMHGLDVKNVMICGY